MNFIIALSIGITAGIIDVIPMLIMKLDKHDCFSAFFHWVALGIVISYTKMSIAPWLKGMIIALLFAIPVIIGLMKRDPKSIPPVAVMSAILGILTGIASSKLIN